MKRQIIKLMAISAAGVMLLGAIGCGAKYPTEANDISEGDQQKLTISSEIVTVGDDTAITAD